MCDSISLRGGATQTIVTKMIDQRRSLVLLLRRRSNSSIPLLIPTFLLIHPLLCCCCCLMGANPELYDNLLNYEDRRSINGYSKWMQSATTKRGVQWVFFVGIIFKLRCNNYLVWDLNTPLGSKFFPPWCTLLFPREQRGFMSNSSIKPARSQLRVPIIRFCDNCMRTSGDRDFQSSRMNRRYWEAKRV